jgi:hypothetical protein
MHKLLPFLFSLLFLSAHAQEKKQLEHSDVQRWKKIEQQRISNDGRWVTWVEASVTEGDPLLWLWDANTRSKRSIPRGTEAYFSDDSKVLVMRIKPYLDTLKAQRRRKVKDDDLPKDSLGILTLATGQMEKIPRLKSFSLPEKWNGWLAFQCEATKPESAKKDSTKTAEPPAKPKGKKAKKEDKDNGYRLILRNLNRGTQDTLAYVNQFALAKKAKRILVQTTGKGDTMTFKANPLLASPGVYLIDLERNTALPLYRKKGKYQHLCFDEQGGQAAFLVDTDTTKARIRPWQLCYADLSKGDTASDIAGPQSAFLMDMARAATSDKALLLSEHTKPQFSEDGTKLYFGAALPPILNDTTLLPEEIVQVEVWAWQEKRIYTEQEVRLENDKKKAFPVVYFPEKKKNVPLGGPNLPDIRFQAERNANIALGVHEEPYAQYLTSEGSIHKDLYAVDLETGERRRIVQDLRCNPRLSAAAKYVLWWSDPDSAWFSYNVRTHVVKAVTNNRLTVFYDEENDVPDHPNEYGVAGWLENDGAVLIYDRYDIWKIDPDGEKKPERLTDGQRKTVHRYLRLDPEEKSIASNARLFLHRTDEATKAESYAWLSLKNGKITPFLENPTAQPMSVSRSPLKALQADALLSTQENYQVFPDLQYTGSATEEGFKNATPVRISEANPQQKDFRWGDIKQVSWTSLTGERISGLLVTPAGYDPTKPYPMIVNFYERMSQDLLKHRAPDFHRSQINFTYYASRGYVIFAPDITYRTGYPGESAYDAIMSGVAYLIDKGIADPKRIALQGHSWGGYQAAYMVTRTNLFRCAEAGAPVANMTSAYGGIRWESGLSRAFQYEHQQSRIGGTLWEKPKQFLENSPLFALDKVQTPLLILHNDKDGAVPWYQGIELYSGLRRLGKPTWLLNYNDEPHWPVKLQNRIDFQTRMQQFFDHYLLDKPQPRWMQRGVPPMEKGILQGME